MNSKIITIDYLKKHHYCKEGIEFFERNFHEILFPIGLDITKLKLKEDYLNYFKYLNYWLSCTYRYDLKGNCIEKSKNNANWKYKYDEYNNLIEENHPNGNHYIYKYNGNNLIEERIGQDIIQYDSNKKIITFIISNKYSYQYEYNVYNDIIKKTYSHGRIEEYSYEYDERENKIKMISSSGEIFKYEYDHNNNLIKETLTDGTIKKYTFNYDSLGRLIQANDCHIEYL